MAVLLNAADEQVCAFFRKKLCPDEHFFQYLAKRLTETAGITLWPSNRRHIRFAPGSNHPDTLALAELQALRHSPDWLARKVGDDTALRFLDETEGAAA